MTIYNNSISNRIMCCCRMFNSRAYSVAGCEDKFCFAPHEVA